MYEYVKKTFNENIFNISNIEENIHLIIYSMIAFLIPFFVGHPQFLVGTLVNSALILSAIYLRGVKLLPVIMLPSIAVLSRGLIFGPFSKFLLYIIPLIWLSNSLLVFVFKKFGKNYFTSLMIGAGLKTLFLFAMALLLVNLNVLPAVFLTAMGLMQLYTALTGGLLSYAVVKVRG